MAIRIRRDGRIKCAAMHRARAGDTYLGDRVHYDLVIAGALVTEPWGDARGRGGHSVHGEWWWSGNVPANVNLDKPAPTCHTASTATERKERMTKCCSAPTYQDGATYCTLCDAEVKPAPKRPTTNGRNS